MKNIDLQLMKNILASYKENDAKSWSQKDYSYHVSLRELGAMEIILVSEGKLKAGVPYEFKEIEFITINWKFQKIKRTRKQLYKELIVEKMEELIKEKENEII